MDPAPATNPAVRHHEENPLMTDSKTTTPVESEMGSQTDDSFAWTEPQPQAETALAGAGAKAQEWLSQLQAMIENLATQAAPVVREVGAKAAELAAMAGEKAGPAAQRAAELTTQAGTKIAERGRTLAGDLRRDAAAAKAAGADAADDVEDAVSDFVTSDESTTAGVA